MWSGLFWSAASAARRKPMLKSTLQQYIIISYCKYNELYSKTPPHAHPSSQVTSRHPPRHTVRSRLSAYKPPGHAVRFRLSATTDPPVQLPNLCALPPFLSRRPIPAYCPILPLPPFRPSSLPPNSGIPPRRPTPFRCSIPAHSHCLLPHTQNSRLPGPIVQFSGPQRWFFRLPGPI